MVGLNDESGMSSTPVTWWIIYPNKPVQYDLWQILTILEYFKYYVLYYITHFKSPILIETEC